MESEKYTRFCQWKNFELNIQLTMNDFSVHRIIGRGGFGEVYGCRKADTGKMWIKEFINLIFQVFNLIGMQWNVLIKNVLKWNKVKP